MEDPRSNKIRLEAFNWLAKMVSIHGDVLPRELLAKGFEFEGSRVPLVSPAGIFKPKQIVDYPLTITSIPGGIYPDKITDQNLIHYRYRGQDVNHTDNIGLRNAYRDHIPLIYLHRIIPGSYLVHWPVFIVGDNPKGLTFTVEAGRLNMVLYESQQPSEERAEIERKIERRYITTQVVQRIHQRAFREMVINAYKEHCAVCRLRHNQLLDGAHIIPDNEGGEPVIQNGLSLCKIHHAAFDNNILGISPDFNVSIRQDILEEIDGPMLRYGLQEMNGIKLYLPTLNKQPNKDWLAIRYDRFRKA